MANKTLNAKIALRYDSYENWTDDSKEARGANLVLLPGEIGLCEIHDATKTVIENGEEVTITTSPTALFKVGSIEGKPFKELPWASAKAADVYSWAKTATKPVYTAEEVGALPDTTPIPSVLADLQDDETHRTVSDEEKQSWNSKSDFSGSYDDLSNKPTIPSLVGMASEWYVSNAISEATASYQTAEQVQGIVDESIETLATNVNTNTENISEINSELDNCAKLASNNTFTGEQHFKNIIVEGNIVQQGETYETHAEKVYTTDDYLIMRAGAEAGLKDGEYTGFHATKYDGVSDGRLVFDNTGTARVGDVGNEQALATRDETTKLVDYNLIRWNAKTNSLEDSGINSIDVFGMQTSIDYLGQNYQSKEDSSLETSEKTIVGAINELRTNVVNHAKVIYYNYATTISINYSNVRTYFKFYQNDTFKILVLSGATTDESGITPVDTTNKIFDLTPLLQQISNREVGDYLDIIINGVDVTPMKCVINKNENYNFPNPLNITFQSSLGYAKAFIVINSADRSLTNASFITLSGTAKNFTEFDINGAVTCCYFSN